RGGRGGILIFCLGLVFGALQQTGGSAEVGDELADGGSSGGARKENGIVQRACGDAAARIRADGGEAQECRRHERRTLFPNELLGDERTQFSDRDLRIVFQRNGFCLAES